MALLIDEILLLYGKVDGQVWLLRFHAHPRQRRDCL